MASMAAVAHENKQGTPPANEITSAKICGKIVCWIRGNQGIRVETEGQKVNIISVDLTFLYRESNEEIKKTLADWDWTLWKMSAGSNGWVLEPLSQLGNDSEYQKYMKELAEVNERNNAMELALRWYQNYNDNKKVKPVEKIEKKEKEKCCVIQ